MTTPIYYVNDRPHLGHYYTTMAADILARFYRLSGVSVRFATGTDEHGAKVAQAAHEKGESPQVYVDRMSQVFQEMVERAGAQPDDFIRTTQPSHREAAQALWQELEDRGQIYLSQYEGWYSVRDEAFYEETELLHTPEGRVAPTGASVEWVQEACYFFRLSHWQGPLLQHYKENPEWIGPESRYNEVVSFVRGGLRDLAISRSKLSWGIPVPHGSHVMYVWMDALTNYLTVLGYPDLHSQGMQHFWPSCVHLLGKDIVRFHGVYWPAFLMAAGLPLPHRLFAHGWWMSEGHKMSKSLGNVVNPENLIQTYGVDALRYFLFRHVRFGHDGDFCHDLFIRRTYQELADGLGNLAYRVLSFLQSRTQGKIPALSLSSSLGVREKELLAWGPRVLPLVTDCMDRQDLYSYLDLTHQGIVKGNQTMTQLAPWNLAKGDAQALEAMHGGLHGLTALLRDIALLLWPVMPSSCTQLLHQLGISDAPSFASIGSPLHSNPLPVPTPLFRKPEIIS